MLEFYRKLTVILSNTDKIKETRVRPDESGRVSVSKHNPFHPTSVTYQKDFLMKVIIICSPGLAGILGIEVGQHGATHTQPRSDSCVKHPLSKVISLIYM